MDKESFAGNVAVAESRARFREIARMEPERLYNLRQSAWESYHDSPLPGRTTNVWRYTDPSKFLIEKPEQLMQLPPMLSGDSPVTTEIPGQDYSACGYDLDDGRSFVRLSPELQNTGVIFKDLFSASSENEDIIYPYLGRLIGHEFGKFEGLNMALWKAGLFMYVPSNVVLGEPIYIQHRPSGEHAFPRILAVIGDKAEVTIIDDYSSADHARGTMVNGVIEMYAGNSSNVRYVNIQRLSERSKMYLTERIQIGQNANLSSVFGSIGGAITKVNAGTILNGCGANSRMYGIVFGDRKQHFDYHTSQHHKASDSFSNLNFKVVLKDKAMSAYTGLIRIEKETVNCEAYQENRNLLLNQGTKAESIPELEILTDQARCTHGATMGPIDPEMVFYLKSRGIDEIEAVRTVVAGFVEPLLNEIPEDVGQMMRDLIWGKLRGNQR